MRQTCKMVKVEERAVIKYLCKKGMTPKEIHEDFMKTPGNEKVQVGKDQEKAQIEKDSHSKYRGGKKPN